MDLTVQISSLTNIRNSTIIFLEWIKLGHFGKYIRNNWKVVNCGAGEGWRRSVGPILWEMKKYYKSQGGEEYPTYNEKKQG
jgi:hypothetical protein